MSLIKESTWTVKGTTLQVKTEGNDVSVWHNGKPLFVLPHKTAEHLAHALNSAYDEVQCQIDYAEDE